MLARHRRLRQLALTAAGLTTITSLASSQPALAGARAAAAVALSSRASSGATARTPIAGEVPVPAVPAGMPAGIEDLAGYVRQTSCDPTAKPGASALASLLTSTYPGSSAGIGRSCGADGMASEHYEGRAVDWMVSVRDPGQAAEANALIGWLFAADAAGHPYANARRLGVMYIIWNNQIWGAYATGSGWRPYDGCAARPATSSDTACHRNHVHLSLSWAGAMGRTSFWSKQVAAPDYGPCRPAGLNWAPAHSAVNPVPCPSRGAVTAPAGSSGSLAALVRWSGIVLAVGSTGPAVSAVQTALGLTGDGEYGSRSAAAVSVFRTGHGLPAGPQVDAATWRALLAAGTATGSGTSSTALPGHTTPPRPVGTGTAGSPGSAKPGTAGAAAGSAKPGSGATGTGSGATGAGSGTTGTPTVSGSLAPFVGTVLRLGARGPAVLALQRALGVTPLSGWFGPVTRAAVTAFQRGHRLPATGVVDAATWRVLTGR